LIILHTSRLIVFSGLVSSLKRVSVLRTARLFPHTSVCSPCSFTAQQVEMNDPHKPGRDDESARIMRAGGWITEEK